MAQTIEAFVGTALDEAKISPLHRRVIALIAAGYFFDVIDFTILGSLIPYIIKSGFTTAGEAAAIGSAAIFGMFIGTAGQGELSDRFGRRFIYQFNLLLFGIFTILGALAPNVTLLVICRFIAGIGLGAEQPLAFAYAGEYSPKRIRGRILAIVLSRLGIAGPTQPLATDAASNTRSDPVLLVLRMFPRRVIAGMICFTAFFGIAVGLGAWLPNIMNAKGFSITKSLQYTLVMNFAVPTASIFMMYALDKFGRKITSVCAFIGAGIMAIVFGNAGTPAQLMVAGFIMVFFVQVAGNAMQIFASEVFPTNARASGFGLASGVGRLATAFILPTILWVQNGWGLTTVFVCLAILLFIAAVSVTQLGPEARQKSLDEIAPPTG